MTDQTAVDTGETLDINQPWHPSKIELATNVKQADGKGKRTVFGYTDCFLPSLDMVHSNLPAPDELKTDKDGVLSIIYNDQVLAAVQKAVTALILAPVRNAIRWTTNEDKEPQYDGQANPAADNWETFLEASGGGNQFLVTKALWMKYFKAYVAALDIPQASKDNLIELVESGKYITKQPDNYKQAVRRQIGTFMDMLPEETAQEVITYTVKMYSYIDAEAPKENAFEF